MPLRMRLRTTCGRVGQRLGQGVVQLQLGAVFAGFPAKQLGGVTDGGGDIDARDLGFLLKGTSKNSCRLS